MDIRNRYKYIAIGQIGFSGAEAAACISVAAAMHKLFVSVRSDDR